MKTAKLLLLVVAVCSVALFTGCKGEDSGDTDSGGSAELDLTTPIDQLKAKIADLPIEDLEKTAMKYKEALDVKQEEITTLTEKFQAVPIAEKMGEDALALQAEIKKITESAASIIDRLEVYVDAIKKKGGEIKAELMP